MCPVDKKSTFVQKCSSRLDASTMSRLFQFQRACQLPPASVDGSTSDINHMWDIQERFEVYRAYTDDIAGEENAFVSFL